MTTDEEIAERALFFKSIGAVPTDSKPTLISHIYWTYVKWALLNNREVMNRTRFSRNLKSLYKPRFYNKHETRYYVTSPYFKLTKKDKIELAEYTKEEYNWLLKQARKNRIVAKTKRTKKLKKLQEKNATQQHTLDSTSDSSPESNKNTTT